VFRPIKLTWQICVD